MAEWRRKHALVKEAKGEVEERIRKLELYIEDLPAPDEIQKQNAEISFPVTNLEIIFYYYFAKELGNE